MRIIPYIIYLLLIAFYVTIWRDLTHIYGATMNIPAFLILAVALYKNEITALWFGFVAGAVASATLPQLMGWHALTGALLGFVGFHVREKLNVDSLAAKLLFTFVGVFIYNTVTMAVNQPGGFLYLLWYSSLTGAAYTTLLATIFYLIRGGQVNQESVKSIF